MGDKLDKVKEWYEGLDSEKKAESNRTNGFLIVAIVSGVTYLIINWLNQFDLSIWEVFAISVIIGGLNFWITRQVQIWIGLPSREIISKTKKETDSLIEEIKEPETIK